MPDDASEFVAHELQNRGVENGIITNYIVIAEILHDDGTEVHVMSTPMSPWLMSGLLDHARMFIGYTGGPGEMAEGPESEEGPEA